MMCWLKAGLTSQMPVDHIYNIKQTHGLDHNTMVHVLTVINRLCLYVIILTFMVKYNNQDQWFCSSI